MEIKVLAKQLLYLDQGIFESMFIVASILFFTSAIAMFLVGFLACSPYSAAQGRLFSAASRVMMVALILPIGELLSPEGLTSASIFLILMAMLIAMKWFKL